MRFFVLIFALFLCSIGHAKAQDFDYNNFAQLPILHEGRIKPIDSFARIELSKFHGHENFGDMSASAWLARALFDPSSAGEDRLFLIENTDLKSRLNLEKNRDTFSLVELQPSLQKTAPQIQTLLEIQPDERTPSQEDLLALHENALQFVQLMRSFSLLLPLNAQPPKAYADLFKGEQPTYISLSRIEKQLEDDLKDIIAFKGDDLQYYTEDEQKIAALSFQLNIFRSAGESNQLLRILPASWDGENEIWLSPWATILRGQGSPANAKYLGFWEQMAKAYRDQNSAQWSVASQAAYEYITKAQPGISQKKLQLEMSYNTYKPYQITLAFYALGVLCVLLGLFFKWPYMLSQITLGFGGIIHAGAISSRIYILDRAPVGTLYESVIFVSLICVVTGLVMSLLRRNNAALFAGAFAGLSMLLIAPYLKPEGESLEMLVAVLNTNFWLSTHVICITIGYAICVIAALLGHGYLALRAFGGNTDIEKMLQKSLYRTSLVALLFTAVGTILGGIWADQSWGRFWGWDPKENGALLIVLWLIWMQHGRISQHHGSLAFAMAAAYLNVIVALSWFGVNLLNVGLHSYGFTSGLAEALTLFCGLQTFILLALWSTIKMRERTIA